MTPTTTAPQPTSTTSSTTSTTTRPSSTSTTTLIALCTPTGCTDGDACTTDGCDPARGCVFTPAAPGTGASASCVLANVRTLLSQPQLVCRRQKCASQIETLASRVALQLTQADQATRAKTCRKKLKKATQTAGQLLKKARQERPGSALTTEANRLKERLNALRSSGFCDG
jgi:hypothetical protein